LRSQSMQRGIKRVVGFCGFHGSEASLGVFRRKSGGSDCLPWTTNTTFSGGKKPDRPAPTSFDTAADRSPAAPPTGPALGSEAERDARSLLPAK
jgi:hypothetical protein